MQAKEYKNKFEEVYVLAAKLRAKEKENESKRLVIQKQKESFRATRRLN